MPGFEESFGPVAEETWLGPFMTARAPGIKLHPLFSRGAVFVQRGERRQIASDAFLELFPGDFVIITLENPYLVRNDQSLGRFLTWLFEPWKIQALIACKAVRVSRGIARVTPADARYALKAGDWVWLDLEAPGLKAALAKAAPASADYVFAPQDDLTQDDDRFIKSYVATLSKRATTTIVDAGVKSLEALMTLLRDPFNVSPTRAKVSRAPLRTLYVVAHALDDGILHVPRNEAIRWTTYEGLESAIKSEELAIPTDAVAPRPNDALGKPIECALRIRGCLIGKQPELLRQLKKAVGPGITKVTAPKLYCGAQELKAGNGAKRLGVAEYMWHDHSFGQQTEITNRFALVAAFKSRGFRDWRNKKVNPNVFETYLPRKSAELTKTGFQPVEKRMWVTIDHGAGAIRAPMRVHYLHRVDEVEVAIDEIERVPVGRHALIELLLVETPKRDARWKDAHPFSMAVRFGYKTMKEMFEAFKLKPRHDVDQRVLTVAMKRYYYGLLVPVTDGDKLMMNFTPEDPTLAPTIQLEETNPAFFGMA